MRCGELSVEIWLRTSTTATTGGDGSTERFADFSLLEIEPNDDPDDPSELQEIAEMQIPVFFWDKYSNIVGDDVTGPDRQAVPFVYSADKDAAINRVAVNGMLDALGESGIPTYVYLAQIDDEVVANPAVSAGLDAVEADLAQIVEDGVGANLTVRTESVVRELGDMNFRDTIHLFDTKMLEDYLRGELCGVIEANGWEADCDN